MGSAFLLYTHHNRLYGALLRAFAGFHHSQPTTFDALASGEPAFSFFFPLAGALKRGLVRVAGRVSVPQHLASFPLFRMAGDRDPQSGAVRDWWLWDGVTERRLDGTLPLECRRPPMAATWSPELLVWRLEQQYRDDQAFALDE